jgi:hypothetical protein
LGVKGTRAASDTPGMGSAPLILAGAGVQVVGFSLALSQSVRTRREDSPEEASLIRWIGAWLSRRSSEAAKWVRGRTEALLRRLHLRKAKGAPMGTNLVGAGASTFAKGHTGIYHRELPMPDRIDHLENDVNELRNREREHYSELGERIRDLQVGVENREVARESKRARQLGRRLRYEELGIVVFLIGLALTTVGAVA